MIFFDKSQQLDKLFILINVTIIMMSSFKGDFQKNW
jgi:hypothetical protein